MVKTLFRLLAGIALISATSAMAAASDDLILQRAVERGRMIYDLDQAAWLSSDVMSRDIGNPAAFGVAGWIVENDRDTAHVIYYRMDHGIPHAAYTADVRDKTVIATHLFTQADNSNLSPIELRMVEARTIATAQQKVACAEAPFNTVVLPPDNPNGPISVYLLSPQTKSGEYPFGGHYAIDVAPIGAVVFSRAFTNGCLTVRSGPPPHAGDKMAGAFITHLLDPTPTEIHVYLSLWMGMPVYVGTQNPSRIWAVNGEQIKLVQPN